MNRRQFVQVMSAAALAASKPCHGQREITPAAAHPGTRRHEIHWGAYRRTCAPHGHSVTLFNRGKTNADFFPQLVHLKGDRDAQLGALKGKHWDAVIDDSGYVPRHVKLSAELLAPNVHRYIFISRSRSTRASPIPTPRTRPSASWRTKPRKRSTAVPTDR